MNSSGAPAVRFSEASRRSTRKPGSAIKHGPLANLAMPAVTMVFRIQDSTILDEVKVGDAIRFRAEQVDGNLTVTQLEPVR